jgi:hypothetical protein
MHKCIRFRCGVSWVAACAAMTGFGLDHEAIQTFNNITHHSNDTPTSLVMQSTASGAADPL